MAKVDKKNETENPKPPTAHELEADYPDLIAEIRADQTKKVEADLRKKLIAEMNAAPADPCGPIKKEIERLIKKYPDTGQFQLALKYVEAGDMHLANNALNNGRRALGHRVEDRR